MSSHRDRAVKVRNFCLEQCVVCVALLVLAVVVVASLAINVRVRSVSKIDLAQCDVSAARLRNTVPFVMAQVSDSHLNINHKAEWTVPLRTFMQRVPRLLPELQFVLHTGDITDGRSKEVPRLSAPSPDDWRAYRDLLVEHNLTDPLFWLDMRGNHDVFNPPGVDLFRLYSNLGNISLTGAAPLERAGRRFRAVNDHVAVFEIDVADAAHTFVYVLFDTCQDNPPIGTMFNFLAYSDAVDVEAFRSELESLSKRTNITALFAAIHYTSNMVHPLGAINRAMHENGVLARLSGHLHLENLHFNDDGSMLDLELADLKEKAAFRLVAYDRGLLSFVDSVVTAPIVALVTSPKRSQYITRNDNLPAMAAHPEVRLLLFGAAADAVVQVSIDGQQIGTALRSNASEHFYTMPYDPQLYTSRTHMLSVTVGGVVVLDDHEFSLDGTKAALRSTVGRSLTGNVAIGAGLTGAFVVSMLLLLALIVAPLVVSVPDDARDWQLVRMWRRSKRLDWPSRIYFLVVCVGCLLLPLLFSDRHSAAIFTYILVSSGRSIVGYADTHFAMLPYALFVVWPQFWLHSNLGVTPLFIVGALFSSAVMIGIIVLAILQFGGVAILSFVVLYWVAGSGLLGRKIWIWKRGTIRAGHGHQHQDGHGQQQQKEEKESQSQSQ